MAMNFHIRQGPKVFVKGFPGDRQDDGDKP